MVVGVPEDYRKVSAGARCALRVRVAAGGHGFLDDPSEAGGDSNSSNHTHRLVSEFHKASLSPDDDCGNHTVNDAVDDSNDAR